MQIDELFMGKLASQLCEHQTLGRTRHFINQMMDWALGPRGQWGSSHKGDQV